MSLYKQSPTGPWWINISHPGEPRIRRSTGTDDRAEAQRIHDEVKAALWSGPKLKGKTWGMAVLHWCGLETRSESELLSLRKFSLYYKDRLLTEVTRESIAAALSFCKSAGTFNRYTGMIAAILNAATAEGWLVSTPKLIRKSEKRKKPRAWITHEQFDLLLTHLPLHMKPMANFAVESGLRRANVLGLRWSEVDLRRKIVWVEAEETKGNKAIAVPLSQGALRVLEGQVGQHDEIVFPYRGRSITTVKTAFMAACVRAGLGHFDKDGKYSGFTWHGLRHTWATWHMQNGTPLEALKELGSWSDLRMVLNYAHHSPGYLATFANNTQTKNADITRTTSSPHGTTGSDPDVQVDRPGHDADGDA